MFLTASNTQNSIEVEELLGSLNVRKKHFSSWTQKTGIDCRAVNRLLQEIKKYHLRTYQHSMNVARLSGLLARQLGLPAVDVYIICIGALLHDIGKITLPHAVLDKPAKLNVDEWPLIKEHPRAGVNIISCYKWGRAVETMLLMHHERPDGKGYYGYSKDAIPHTVKIITLADAYDAMVSSRPYQKKRDFNACWEEIERCSGTQFDADLLPDFYSVLTRKANKYKV